ncbi:hypothetical protein EDD85DRAFT_250230 [Armillaria nabsnona]|nr:hypothetical protein EDD85DRAFT_250230 [Armillaria nabsnona]
MVSLEPSSMVMRASFSGSNIGRSNFKTHRRVVSNLRQYGRQQTLRRRLQLRLVKATKVVEDHDDSVPKVVSGTFITQYLLAVLSFPVSDGGSQNILCLILIGCIFATGRTAIDSQGCCYNADRRWSHRRRRHGCVNAYQAMWDSSMKGSP